MKAERLVATPSRRRRKKSLFAVCIQSRYPGEFELSGRHWRVVTGIPARSAKEAFEIFQFRLGGKSELDYIATTYEPAIDVLMARQQVLRS